jgi:nitrate reductase NapAB chaperone NapD
MIITGSALFIRSESYEEVVEGLKLFPEVTFHAASDSRTELVITIEANDHHDLERLCTDMQEHIPGIVEVAHLSINFEEEIEKIRSGRFERASLYTATDDDGSSGDS